MLLALLRAFTGGHGHGGGATNGDDVLNGTSKSDKIDGKNGNDVINGNGGNDKLNGGKHNDTINGGSGNDHIDGGDGDDILDGNSGNDHVDGGKGNDTLVYSMSENNRSSDHYDGGSGNDTLHLKFTEAEWLRADVQADIARLLDYLDDLNDPRKRCDPDFKFKSFNLRIEDIENVRISVEGVEIDPEDQAVIARDDSYGATENGGAITGSVLDNDDVPDLVKKIELLSGPAKGTLVFSLADGTFSFNPGGAFEGLGAGDTENVVFTYRVTDADGDKDTATVTITVTGVNDTAVIGGGTSGAVTEDAPIDTTGGQLTISDADAGEAAFATQAATAGDYGSFSVDSDGTWSYELDNASAAVQALAGGQAVSDSFTVTSIDGTTVEITINVTGTNDAPVIDEGASDLDGTATEDTPTIVAPSQFLAPLAPDLSAFIGDQILSYGDDMAGLLANVQAEMGGASLAEAITAVWQQLDANYVTYYGPTVNEAFARLGIEYGKYLLAGGDALTDLIAKFQPDTNSNSIPQRLQSLHDNLLGNLNDLGLTDRFLFNGGSPLPAVYASIIDALDAAGLNALLARPVYSGNEGAINLSAAYDEANGFLPTDTGILVATDVDNGDTLTWSAAPSAGVYGDFEIDASSGEWTYRLDNGLAATQALAAGEIQTETFTATVMDTSGETDTVDVTITVTGVNDAPVLDAAGPFELAPIDENDSGNAGQTVASIVGPAIDDVDNGAAEGIAITGADDGNGTWQFFDGTDWTDFGTYSEANALLLTADTLVRFEPNGFAGTDASFDFMAWDGTSGSNLGAADASVRGGTTAFSQDEGTATIDVAELPIGPSPAGQVWVYDENEALVAVYSTVAGTGPSGVPYIVNANPINAAVEGVHAGVDHTVVVGAGSYTTGGQPIDIEFDGMRVLGNQWDVDPRAAAGLRSVGGANESIVNGGGGTQVFRIRADNVELNGFEMFNTSADVVTTDGITGVGGDSGAIISHNIVRNAGDDGLVLFQHSNGVIEYNLIFATNDGINVVGNNGTTAAALGAFDNVVRHNEVDGGFDNGGIYVYGSARTVITDNYVHDYVGDSGIVLGIRRGFGNPDREGGTVSNNIVEGSGENGIDIFQSDVVVTGNTVTGSRGWAVSIGIDYNNETAASPKPDNVVVEDNIFANNNLVKNIPVVTGPGSTPGSGPVRIVNGSTNISFDNNDMSGNAANNTLTGTTGIDTIKGLGGDDTLRGGLGDDTLYGGDELAPSAVTFDTAVFSGNSAAYTIVADGSEAGGLRFIVTGADGVDTLIGIEKAQFSDLTIDLF